MIDLDNSIDATALAVLRGGAGTTAVDESAVCQLLTRTLLHTTGTKAPVLGMMEHGQPSARSRFCIYHGDARTNNDLARHHSWELVYPSPLWPV